MGPMILRDIYNMNLYKTIIYIMYYIYIYIYIDIDVYIYIYTMARSC